MRVCLDGPNRVVNRVNNMIIRSIVVAAMATFALTTQAANSEWYRYPAVSPDGSQVAFSHNGDIYVVSSAGGVAIPMTVHTAHEGYPVWSRDGRYLAFASDRHGNYDIFVMPASGGAARRLTYHSSDDIPSDFSPDDNGVIFTSARIDSVHSAQFPDGRLPETYRVALSGGTPSQITTLAAESARYNRAGDRLLYQDNKGYEDQHRKHHRSSVTRDIWLLDVANDLHTRVTAWLGEDRNPVWADNDHAFYCLSERSGTFNVWKKSLVEGQPMQITHHDIHPVRFLSQDDNGNLVYGYHGSIYRLAVGATEPQKLAVRIIQGDKFNPLQRVIANGSASEFAVSPNGKEVAFIVRGEVYVTAVDYASTKRITTTAEQERSVSFSPDGRSLLYAGERNGSWNLYRTRLVSPDETYFYSSTRLAEEVLLANGEEAFQPAFSPDAKEVAYLANRDSIKVLNLDSKETRLVLPTRYNYSYDDGDVSYEWSPDGKWLAMSFLTPGRMITEVGIVPASGKIGPVNLTLSGYADSKPHWALAGKAITWMTTRHGQRNHGSWGAEADIYGLFLDRDAWDTFQLNEEEYVLRAERQRNGHDDASDKQEENKKAKKRKKNQDKKEDLAPEFTIDLAGIEDRQARLTLHSADLGEGLLSNDGRQLYYLAKFEKGYDLWMRDFNENSTRLLIKLGAEKADIKLDKTGKHLFILADGQLSRLTLNNGKSSRIPFAAEVYVDADAERTYMFEHAWRQVREKFYRKDLHGVDWDRMKNQYAPKLAGINNNRDFADLLGEMLGELNASHTGGKYRPLPNGHSDETAALGIFVDYRYAGDGIRIAEIVDKSPLLSTDNKIRPGMIITAIDDQKITHRSNYYALLNHKENERVLLTVLDPNSKKKESQTFEQVVKPISHADDLELRYLRWVKKRRELVDQLSAGRLGYVHVKAMDTDSFQQTYSEVLGRNIDKEALIVDTRFNGGGWLHDDLNSLLSGQKYYTFLPRNRPIGYEPINKWWRPSAVVVGEGNYSDAYLFPHSYKQLNIGPLIGMPVPATGTAVWWERLISGDVVFGIPQVGMLDNEGNLQENHDLMPDYQIDNDPNSLVRGRDRQIEKAVVVLLQPGR